MRAFLAQLLNGAPSTTQARPDASVVAKDVAAIPVRLLRRREAARYVTETWGIPLSWRTLAKLAVTGDGPDYCKVGRYPLYSPADLDSWAASKLQTKRRGARDDARIATVAG